VPPPNGMKFLEMVTWSSSCRELKNQHVSIKSSCAAMNGTHIYDDDDSESNLIHPKVL